MKKRQAEVIQPGVLFCSSPGLGAEASSFIIRVELYLI